MKRARKLMADLTLVFTGRGWKTLQGWHDEDQSTVELENPNGTRIQVTINVLEAGDNEPG